MRSDDLLIVVGAGHAGAELAVQAREAGWAGGIVLVGDEPALPYHRPPLSKGYLAGQATLDALALKARATYDKAGVQLMSGHRVRAIDLDGSRVHFDDGSAMAYSRLALATGGRARPLPLRRRAQSARRISTTCARSPTSIASASASSRERSWSSWAEAMSAWRWPRSP